VWVKENERMGSTPKGIMNSNKNKHSVNNPIGITGTKASKEAFFYYMRFGDPNPERVNRKSARAFI
jgi:hypothetical protein